MLEDFDADVDNHGMSIVDLFVISFLVFFGVIGIVRGLVAQLFSLAGLIAGHLAGIHYCAFVVTALELKFKYAKLVGYIVILAAVFIMIALIGSFIGGKIRNTRMSAVNRVLGLFAGMLKGGLLSVLLVYILIIIMPKEAAPLRKSFAVPYALAAGQWLIKEAPPQVTDSFKEKLRAIEPPGVRH